MAATRLQPSSVEHSCCVVIIIDIYKNIDIYKIDSVARFRWAHPPFRHQTDAACLSSNAAVDEQKRIASLYSGLFVQLKGAPECLGTRNTIYCILSLFILFLGLQSGDPVADLAWLCE